MEEYNDFKPKGAFEGWVHAKISMLCNEVKDIRENHLTSIYERLNESNRKPSWIIAIVIATMFSLCSGLIVGIAVSVLKK